MLNYSQKAETKLDFINKRRKKMNNLQIISLKIGQLGQEKEHNARPQQTRRIVKHSPRR